MLKQSKTLSLPKKLSFLNIKNNNLKNFLQVFVILVLGGLVYFSMNKFYIENSNDAIAKTVAAYIETINQKRFDDLTAFYYPENKDITDEQILLLKAKSSLIQMESMRVKEIYPALVVNDIALIGCEISTTNRYNGEKMVLQEITTFVLLRKNGLWYIAKPEDLGNYNEEYISALFKRYEPILIKNMPQAETIKYYNGQAYQKFLQTKLEKPQGSDS